MASGALLEVFWNCKSVSTIHWPKKPKRVSVRPTLRSSLPAFAGQFTIMVLPKSSRHSPRCEHTAQHISASPNSHIKIPRTKMCTGARFWYSCRCPATRTFRDSTCCLPDPPTCYSTKRDYVLPSTCPMCLRWDDRRNATTTLNAVPTETAKKLRGSHVEDKLVNDLIDSGCWTWHVPSRCFTDPGFVRLDPFAADRYKRAIQYEAEERRAMCKLRNWGSLKRRWEDIMDVLAHRWSSSSIHFPVQLGPCCARATIARRLEESLTGETARRGPHGDDRCMSNF